MKTEGIVLSVKDAPKRWLVWSCKHVPRCTYYHWCALLEVDFWSHPLSKWHCSEKLILAKKINDSIYLSYKTQVSAIVDVLHNKFDITNFKISFRKQRLYINCR